MINCGLFFSFLDSDHSETCIKQTPSGIAVSGMLGGGIHLLQVCI